MTAYAIVDLETTIKFSYKRKANPFDPENWIVMAGALEAEEEWGKAYYYLNREESHKHDWFRSLLKRTKLLVGFNFKFDIHHLIQCPENYAAWMAWVANGGQVWDCQLAEYLLNGMGAQDQYLSLDEVAPRYGGNLKVDEVKLLWEDGVDTPDIDRDLLERYLVGEPETGDQGDLGNTRIIFRKQLERARRHGQLKSILLNMGSLLYTIEAEHQGMAVDYELGCKLAAEREVELAKLTAELTKFVPDDLPFEFNWGSRNHLSALIFGGQVKYVAKAPILDDDGNLTYYQKEVVNYETEDGRFIEASEYDAKAADEPQHAPPLKRYASGKKKGEAKTKKVKVNDLERGPKERNEDFYYQFPGFTKPRKEWETKTPGVYSTAADTIEALGNRNIPFLKTLAEHSLVSKDLKTYFITTDEKTGEKKGMLTLVDNGIIHHSLNHVNTVTGRFSSSNPNLQNLSGKGKSKVKSLFVSRYPNGKVIQSDFTSLEIFIQAVLTKCPNLIDDLKAGLDMHCLRVSQKEGIPYEEAVRLCKTEELSEWVAKRRGAKEFSFQRAYGAGIAKIAETTGMAEEDVQALADAEAERYPEIDTYFQKITEAIEQSTKLTGVKVPHPDFPAKIVDLGRGFHRTPDGKLYSWRQNPAPKYVVERTGKWASYSPPEVKNYEVQGGGAEWAKAAMWLAIRAFYSLRNFEGRAVLVNQVHDACYADAAPEVAPQAAALLHVAMEHASPFIEKYFGWDQPVAVPSDTTWGDSMIEESKPIGMEEHIPWATEIVKSFY